MLSPCTFAVVCCCCKHLKITAKSKIPRKITLVFHFVSGLAVSLEVKVKLVLLHGAVTRCTQFLYFSTFVNVLIPLIFQINKIHKTYCKKYATIKETEATRETVVCGGEEREKVVFISAGSTVEITMQSFTSLKRKDTAHFLLKYEGI